MNPAILVALLPLIEALLSEAPALIADVEAIISKVKGGASGTTTAETGGAIAPQVAADMASAADALNTPIVKP